MEAHARPPHFNLRFSLKGAILLMAAVAVGAAAFRDASQTWMMIWTLLALGAIFFAIVAAVYGHPDRQAFWTGFAIFAAPYFLFAIRFKDSNVLAGMATTKAIDFIIDKTHPYLVADHTVQSCHPDIFANLPPARRLTPRANLAMSVISTCCFLQVTNCYPNLRAGDDLENGIHIEDRLAIIGQSQASLLLGLLGGFLAQGLATCRLRQKRDLSLS